MYACLQAPLLRDVIAVTTAIPLLHTLLLDLGATEIGGHFRYYGTYADLSSDGSELLELGALAAWTRPFAAIAAGMVADKLSSSRVVLIAFGTLVVAFTSFAWSTPSPTTLWVLWLNVGISCVAVFALRGVYFAMLEETAVPAAVTGTAVGVISFVGYTPDIFIPPIAGWLIDRSPGAAGHQLRIRRSLHATSPWETRSCSIHFLSNR